MNWSIAKKNFSRQGLRASLNVLVTALSIIALVFMLSLLNGFQAQATRNVVNTDVGGGHYRAPGFDILSPTEWEDHTVIIPDTLRQLDNKEKAEILVLQGQLYPNRRLYPVQIRGISMEQSLLKLPLDNLKKFSKNIDNLIPAVVGTKMAKKSSYYPFVQQSQIEFLYQLNVDKHIQQCIHKDFHVQFCSIWHYHE